MAKSKFLEGHPFFTINGTVAVAGVGRNPVEPSVEIALELKSAEIAQRRENYFLIYIFRIFLVL